MNYLKVSILLFFLLSFFACKQHGEKCDEIIDLGSVNLKDKHYDQCFYIKPYTEIIRESDVNFTALVYGDTYHQVSLNIPIHLQKHIKLDTNTNSFYIDEALVISVLESRKYYRNNIIDITNNPKREKIPNYVVKASFKSFQSIDHEKGVRYFYDKKDGDVIVEKIYMGRHLYYSAHFNKGVFDGERVVYYKDTNLIKVKEIYDRGLMIQQEEFSKSGNIIASDYKPHFLLDSNEVSLDEGSKLTFLTKDTTYHNLRLYIGKLDQDFNLVDTNYYQFERSRKIELTRKYDKPGQHIIQGLLEAIDTVNHKIRQVSFTDTVFVIDW